MSGFWRSIEIVAGYFLTMRRPDAFGRPDCDYGNDALAALAEVAGREWAARLYEVGQAVAGACNALPY